MRRRPVLLFSGARTVPFDHRESFYDHEKRMTLVLVDGQAVPLVEASPSPVTQSKTAQAPGDDDPDPQDERCY